MNKCKTEIVKFQDDELIVLTTDDGKRHVALKPITNNLGLDWAGQARSIKADPVLAKRCRLISIPTNSGFQQMLFLELEYFNGWIFKININRVAEHARVKLAEYQEKGYKVLHQHFNGGTQKDELDILEGAIQALRDVRGRVDALENKHQETKQDIAEVKQEIKTLAPTPNYYTITGYANLLGVLVDRKEANALGRQAALISKSSGIPIGKFPHEYYGQVNSYHTTQNPTLFTGDLKSKLRDDKCRDVTFQCLLSHHNYNT